MRNTTVCNDLKIEKSLTLEDLRAEYEFYLRSVKEEEEARRSRDAPFKKDAVLNTKQEPNSDEMKKTVGEGTLRF